MKNFTISAAVLAMCLAIGTGAQAQNFDRSYQAYGIVDVQTNVGKDPIIISLDRAVRGYASDMQSNRPIMVPVPEEPRRFELVNPLASSGLGALAAMAGVSSSQMQVATCEGAVWTSFIQRQIAGNQSLRLWLCLFPYRNAEKSGYQLNFYVQDTEERGGGISLRLGRAMANAMVGGPRVWTERLLRSTVAALEDSAGVQAILIEGEPEIPALLRPREQAQGAAEAKVSADPAL